MTAPEHWHLVTCEYPPQVGGVSDYSFAVARALAASGRNVHVWCPETAGTAPESDGVTIHRELGGMTPADLRRAGHMLDGFSAPSRLLVQWVPHGYGYRSLNLPFACWVARRALRKGTQLDLVVHEPYLAWSARPTQLVGAFVHRIMLSIAASAATRLWVTIPAWAPAVRSYAVGRAPIRWLPVPSPVPVASDASGVVALRRQLAPANEPLLGHFGSYSPLVTSLLAPALERVLAASALRVVLIGNGSQAFADEFVRSRSQFAGRLQATGTLEASILSRHLQACDLMLQPYPDGVSSRRTTMVALLQHGQAAVTNDGHLTDEIWRDSGAVELVCSADPRLLAEAVMSLLNDKERRARLGAAARQLHDRVFDVRHTIAALVETDGVSLPAGQEAAAR